MRYCTKCGGALVENARFCNSCGAPVSEFSYAGDEASAPKNDEQLKAQEQQLLDSFSLGLKHERLAYKIVGIVFTVMSAIFICISLVFWVVSFALLVEGDLAFSGMMVLAGTYFICGLMYLPVAIINLCMCKKLESYRNKLYSDCADGIGHYSVGSIVFSAFFNSVALVFIIIYFVKAKNSKHIIERIKARQSAYNSMV